MTFDYPHINSPEAEAIITQAKVLIVEEQKFGHIMTEDDKEVILEAALIISARKNPVR